MGTEFYQNRQFLSLLTAAYQMDCQEDASLQELMSDEMVSSYAKEDTLAEHTASMKSLSRKSTLMLSILARSDINEDERLR